MAFLKTNEKKQLSIWEIKRFFSYVRRAGLVILNLLLPPKCLKCASRVADAHNICPGSWKKLSFISDPKCYGYSFPFGSEYGRGYSALGDAYCAACQKLPHIFDQATSARRYDDECRSMILGFKHQDIIEYTQYFSELLYQASRDFWHDTDIIVPVPFHKKRPFKQTI